MCPFPFQPSFPLLAFGIAEVMVTGLKKREKGLFMLICYASIQIKRDGVDRV